MSSKISSKLMEFLKNIKSDAVPRAPRPERTETNEEHQEQHDENDENIDSSNDSGITIEEIEDEDIKKENKPTFKKKFFSKKTNSDFKPKKDKKADKDSKVYTQAAGNVINIMNANDIQWGNRYYMGQTMPFQQPKQNDGFEPEDNIRKCNLIKLLMEDNEEPQHVYLDYISKNLGKNWRNFFRSLGYKKGRIETCEIDAAHYGVSEARYKLLLDWVRNNDDSSLGHLAELLWEEGERQIVKDLALLYKKSNQKGKKC